MLHRIELSKKGAKEFVLEMSRMTQVFKIKVFELNTNPQQNVMGFRGFLWQGGD